MDIEDEINLQQAINRAERVRFTLHGKDYEALPLETLEVHLVSAQETDAEAVAANEPAYETAVLSINQEEHFFARSEDLPKLIGTLIHADKRRERGEKDAKGQIGL